MAKPTKAASKTQPNKNVLLSTEAKPGSPRVKTLQPKDSGKHLTDKERGIHDTALSVTKAVDGNQLAYSTALPMAKQLIADGLQQLTGLVAMRNLQPVELREIFDYSKGVEDAVKEASGFARARVLELALRVGEATGTNGDSRKLVYPDGRFTLAKIQRSGTDPKKFEAALRAKGVNVEKYMVAEIKYKLPSDFDGPARAVDEGVFSADEVKTFDHEPTYAVERSKEEK